MGSKTIQLRRNKFYDPFAQIDRNINGTERHKNNAYIYALGRQQLRCTDMLRVFQYIRIHSI